MKHKLFILAAILFLVPMTTFSADWVPMTSGTTQGLTDIWGTSGTDVFAVGLAGTILHYNGVEWSPMNSGTTEPLFGIWGTSSTNVFAAGNKGIIVHYDGYSWSAMESGTNYNLYDLWGSSENNIYVVGAVGPYPNTSVILHYNGSAWSQVYSSSDGARDIWGSSADDFFVPYVFGHIGHWNGSSWSMISFGSNNYGVWGSAWNDVFVVGQFGTVMHYDGSNWSYMPNQGSQARHGVWGSSGSDVFVVGEGGIIYHYDGNNWAPMSSGTTEYLPRVWGSSGSDVFAVGSHGTILHYDGAPTLIELSYFTATSSYKKVIIKWSTESEKENAGFNLYRATAEDGEYKKINDTLILTQGSSTQGARYEYIDNGLRNGKIYYYKLEDVALNGVSTMHDEVSATPRWIYSFIK